jgi:DNA-binding NarL/FixJ family response regulator
LNFTKKPRTGQLSSAAETSSGGAAITPTRLALVGVSEELSASITQRLRQYPDMAVVLTSASVEDMLGIGVSTAVDVVLLDVAEAGGVTVGTETTSALAEMLNKLQRQFAAARVIALVPAAALRVGVAALAAGVSGLLDRSAESHELVAAIRLVRNGQRFLGSPYLEEAIDYFTQTQQVFSGIDGYDTLTRREQELLWWIASGYTSAEIAQHFSLSPRTVETHRNNIMAKLNLHNRSELTRLSLQLQRRVVE